jgi:hypothetical protein
LVINKIERKNNAVAVKSDKYYLYLSPINPLPNKAYTFPTKVDRVKIVQKESSSLLKNECQTLYLIRLSERFSPASLRGTNYPY